MEQPKKESINIMNCSISSIYYCPVKSLSFQNIESCNVKKELGMINDRIFAFSRGFIMEINLSRKTKHRILSKKVLFFFMVVYK